MTARYNDFELAFWRLRALGHLLGSGLRHRQPRSDNGPQQAGLIQHVSAGNRFHALILEERADRLHSERRSLGPRPLAAPGTSVTSWNLVWLRESRTFRPAPFATCDRPVLRMRR